MNKKAYVEGLDMKQFTHIPSISVYNCNYYNGFGSDLLYGESDDDNVTEWYLVEHNSFIYLGDSYCSEQEKLRL